MVQSEIFNVNSFTVFFTYCEESLAGLENRIVENVGFIFRTTNDASVPGDAHTDTHQL